MLPSLHKQKDLQAYLLNSTQHQQLHLLVSMFNDRDLHRTGTLKLPDLRGILHSMGCRVNLRQIIEDLRIDSDAISFDEVVIIVAEAQRIVKRKSSDIRQNVMYEYLRTLDQYRIEAGRQEQYREADKAENKIKTLRDKFMKKQIEKVKNLQNEEMDQLEIMHRTKFQKFNSAWVDYMSDYESKVFQQIDRLKETHLYEMNELEEQAREEFLQSLRPSREVIELRTKAKNLARQRSYKEAAVVKEEAELIHKKELRSKRKEMESFVRKKSQQLRRRQEKTLKALLKRVEKDRSEQLTKRKDDCQQMLCKIKNLKKEVGDRHNEEQKRVSICLQSRLESARISTGFSQNRSQSKLRSSSMRNVERIFDRLHLYNP